MNQVLHKVLADQEQYSPSHGDVQWSGQKSDFTDFADFSPAAPEEHRHWQFSFLRWRLLQLQRCQNLQHGVSIQTETIGSVCLGTCVGIDAVVGFYHDETGVASAGIGRGEAGRRGGHARRQSDGQSGWIVAPGLPLKTQEQLH